MVNQQTPYGSLTFDQTGQSFTPSETGGQQYYYNASTGEYSTAPHYTSQSTTTEVPRATIGGGSRLGQSPLTRTQTSQVLDPAWQDVGKGFMTPQYTATTTLSPEQQAILDQTQAANLNLGTLANERSAFLKDYLSQNVDLSTAGLKNYIDQNWATDFNTEQDRQQGTVRSQLINAGIRPGTPAYDQAMSEFAKNRSSGYDRLLSDTYGQAANFLMTERNQPLNEISALLGGSQIQNPNFVSTPQTQVGGVDYAGLVADQYAAEQQASSSAMGGIFGLLSAPFKLGSGAGLLTSDRRLKRDIERIGAVGRLPWYRFNYVWDLPCVAPREGFMSDDVRQIAPHAVVADADGFDAVDYAIAMEAA
ncbi:tail fiber domain-containing protein [Ancylobacter sonchi]|uniref:tail fiber domain-containing protein n=1 Tax=Ancylobacter sonchi TaxID=1937790 RepID=UPI001BD1C037|nr:tail fiber domain-containing protein [Ancylobacter sonchi]MBS7534825.1 tail fiber domain-containing protein [Ancylobacter sonchi]